LELKVAFLAQKSGFWKKIVAGKWAFYYDSVFPNFSDTPLVPYIVKLPGVLLVWVGLKYECLPFPQC